MIRITDVQSSGKTFELLKYAKDKECVVVCSNPIRMADKAQRYGIGFVECISYDEFLRMYRQNQLSPRKYVIDEMEKMVESMFSENAVFEGYNLTIL